MLGILFRSKSIFVLGFFHPWLHLTKISWKFFAHVIFFFFKQVFPKAKWFNFPKTNQILTFYQTLLALHSIIVPFTKELLSFNNNEFCQSLLDFFEHTLPFIFTYKIALKQRNYSLLQILQPKLWLLLTFMGCSNYSKAVLFQNLLFSYWEKTDHFLAALLHSVPNFFNEEIGEISLSTVARSTRTSFEHCKTLKLKQNYPFVSKIREASDFFGIKLPFKHSASNVGNNRNSTAIKIIQNKFKLLLLQKLASTTNETRK